MTEDKTDVVHIRMEKPALQAARLAAHHLSIPTSAMLRILIREALKARKLIK